MTKNRAASPISLFLSYARDDDEPFVRHLNEDLQRQLDADGRPLFDVWFDRVSMPARRLTFYQEIRDAVAACDRLVLVVGPKAVTSDYVAQEWRFAYFEADKCVNPIVRLDGATPAGEEVDGYELMPEDLKLLHAEDFRDDSRYDEHLRNLVRQLSEDPPRVGKLVAVPELPPHYRQQRDRIEALRDLLLIDLQKPVVVRGAAARVGVQGMGGIGKSVLANALARRPEVRRAFPDGIFWVGLGQTPDLAALQRRLAAELGDEALFDHHVQGKETLRKLLAERAALLVLDDVWQRGHAEAFNVVGPRGRLLLTTRDTGLVTALAATENHYKVELPTMAEAEELLAAAAEVRDLPAQAREVIEECGRLPLALALCGGMVAGATPWSDLLEALREHDLEFLSDDHPPEDQHANVWKTMDVSIRALGEDQRDRFAELAVFAADGGVPASAVVTLWEHTAGLSPRHARRLLADFARRSLVQTLRGKPGEAASADRITLHDLLHGFACGMAAKRFRSSVALHTRLLNAYRAKCPDGWPGGPNDGYFFEHLRDHLLESDQGEQVVELLQELRWLEAKNEHGLVFDLPADYSAAIEAMDHNHPRRRILELLDEAVRRDIHFIARHADDYPEALFQCLWNTCWWYDCPEVAAHYVEPEGGWTAQNAPWKLPGEARLHPLLERWREAREQSTCPLPWLRSHRPPAMHLGSGQLAVLRGHDSGVTSVVFSSDGQRIASGSLDQTARVWDAESGAELAVLRGHEDQLTSVVLSGDGRRIASGSNDETIRVWDAESGAQLVVLRGHKGTVTVVGFSADGRRIASGTGEFSHYASARMPLEDFPVWVWDAESGAELAVLRGHQGDVTSVALSGDGRRIASGSLDRTVRVWDVESGAELAILRGHKEKVTSVVLSGDGRRIVSGSNDKTVRVWDAQSGNELRCLQGHESSVTGVAVSGDGGRVASGSLDQTVRVWDAGSGAELAILSGHERVVTSVAMSGDGQRVASGSHDGTVRVWDADIGAEPRLLRGHENVVTGVAVSRDGWRVASGSLDQTVRVWDAESGAELWVLPGHERLLTSVAMSGDGRWAASGSRDDTIRLWDAHSGVELTLLCGHESYVTSVSFSPDGERIASGSEDNTVRVWDAETGHELRCLRGHKGKVTIVAFSGDGQRIASGSSDQTARVWDADSGNELRCLRGHEGPVTGVAVSGDGCRVASGSWDKTVRVWDVESGTELAILRGHQDWVTSVAMSGDGRRIVSASGFGSGLAITGDGRAGDGRLVVAPSTLAMWVWDAETGECLGVTEGSGDVAAIAAGLPWRAINRSQETVIEPVGGGDPVAWFSIPLDHIGTYPDSRTWAGCAGKHLYIITLEGDPKSAQQNDGNEDQPD